MKQQNKTDKGFTIIEVVLVLAIAGLIFLMVFIALPALQRNQRDTQRREDVSRFMSQIEQYRTNNRGKVPTDASVGAFVTSYVKDFNDPSTGSAYPRADTEAAFDAATTPGTYYYSNGAKCEDEEVVTGTARQAAIAMKLEGSGIYCQSN